MCIATAQKGQTNIKSVYKNGQNPNHQKNAN